jgi:ribonuclease inhibitor
MDRVERVVLELSTVESSEALHDLLSDRLAFPSYYGRNWDAFWDCIRDPEQSCMPRRLCVRGYEAFSERLPRDARLLRSCLEDLADGRSDVVVEWQ